jgi:hypothetical protein
MRGNVIVQLLESWGLHGPVLFLVALGLSLAIVAVSYFLAMWGLQSRKPRS